MAESRCFGCYFLGKPPARVNFIILTGLPESPVRNRIRWLLDHGIEPIRSSNIADLTDYQSLNDGSVGLFSQASSPIVSSSIPKAAPLQKCCHGSYNMPVCTTDSADSTQLDILKENIFDQVKAESKADDTKMSDWRETPTWIILDESNCLEPKLLSIFLQLNNNKHAALLDFTFTVLCLLGNEHELFENCVLQRITIDDYESIIYPAYQRRIKDFFTLLHSSSILRRHTVLVEQRKLASDVQLFELLQNLLHYDTIEYNTFQKFLEHYVTNLPSLCQHTIPDIRTVQNYIRGSINATAEERLKRLYKSLQDPHLDEKIVYEIARLVLIDFKYMEAEKLTIYKKKLIRGFNKDDFKNLNTIAARLIHHALELIRKQENTTISLIHSIVLIIHSLGKNVTFRHDLFDYNPKIYTLSMELVSQRQYALVLAGLKLCTTILDGDLIEHKYANDYLKYDPHPARKMMNAIKWLLSPYQTMQIRWRKELQDEDLAATNTNEQELASTSLERQCYNHTAVLADRQYLQGLASLLCGSLNQCLEMTVDDVRVFAESIVTLADSRLSRWRKPDEKHFNLILISNLCSILIPILQYSSPDVSSALRRENLLLKVIPEAIQILSGVDIESIDPCFRFYSILLQMKRKDFELRKVGETKKSLIAATEEVPTNTTLIHSTETTTPLKLTPDLIVSYFDLNRKYSKFILQDEKSTQNNSKKLLKMEWEKFDFSQLKYEHEQLRQQYSSLQNTNEEIQKKNLWIESERNRLQMENTQLLKEIDCRQAMNTNNTTADIPLLSSAVSSTRSTQKNIIDKLRDVSPDEITEEQAKMFIEEIHHRRMAFDDEDMRKSICGSLKHLGSHLYTSSVHFLHELIQNAEDNFYDPGSTPSLRIVLNRESILLSNNEKGLRPRDVLAICSLAVTTKQLDEHIGEKGVGFKSVFAASNQPTLISRAWKFAFHVSDDAMSYITPVWVSNEHIPNRIRIHINENKLDTHLYLPLKPQVDVQAVDRFLDQVVRAVDPCVLLTLCRLKKLEIIDERQDKKIIIEKQISPLTTQETVTFEAMEFINLIGFRIQLSTSIGESNFWVYTCDINVPMGIELGRKASKTRLTLAFPCEADYRLEYTVYAGLPVCDLGFGFLFSGDFELVTNRESVRENAPFNRILRDHLAILFVYLLLYDVDVRKNMDRYWPSSTTNKVKHSFLWSGMIIKIKDLISKNSSILFNINAGKSIRRFNPELATLVSNEQLYDCADIQVVSSANGVFTDEQLKEFEVQPVSPIDVLNCFPNRDEESNEFRQKFYGWAQKRSQDWWNQFFQNIARIMTEQVGDLLLRKPIFLQFDHHRQYFSIDDTSVPLLFISDDSSLQMWKRQLILLKYASISERTALLNSNRVQLLTDDKLIEIIRIDHLQIADFCNGNNITEARTEEIWGDLTYLRSRLDKLDRSTRLLAPRRGSRDLVAIQDAILPTILCVDIQTFLNPSTSSILHYPYRTRFDDQLNDNLQWEYFFLQMNCHPPAIHIPILHTINRLPILPSFTMFKNEEMAKLALEVFSSQLENTQDCLRQFFIKAERNNQEENSSVSTTFDKKFAPSLTWLPRVAIPPYCCPLAVKLGVGINYDLQTCVRVLQLLGDAKSTDLQLYVEWLGHLQLFILQQGAQSKPTNLRSLCSIYLPDQQEVCRLEDLLIVTDHIEHRAAIRIVSKYLKLQVISPSSNQIYWPFQNLFRTLNCSCAATISNIFGTIHLASCDSENFHSVGDCITLLTELGVETMLTLYKYLEHLILECVKENNKDEELFHTVVEQRHPTALYGSREDWKWRFSFTCNSLSKRLRIRIGMGEQRQKLPLLTIDKQLIVDLQNTIVYACMEQNIIRHFAKNSTKRYFISPSMICTCPLVLAAFEIDYIERRGMISWGHKTNNTEYSLPELTDCFRQTLEDSELEVITSVYAYVNLLLSDSILLNPNSEDGLRDADCCLIEKDYPFWVFNKTILLCISSIDDNAKKAYIATYALITMLNKRKLMPIEEAKLLARQTINSDTKFHSKELASVAYRKSTYYSYTDLLFPTDQYAIESSVIMIGKQFTTEQDSKNKYTRKVAIDREAEDRVYRSRVRDQDHRRPIREESNVWTDPKRVDCAEQIRIGENAEHFFFDYLQKCYGTEFVTPTRNWRSSIRLKTYPDCQDDVDDNAGYDFELQDTDGIFAQGSGSHTIHCFFEVKGTSGPFNEEKTRFHISENEFKTCEDIACDVSRRQRDAYFLVIVQYSLDSQKISLGEVINWSQNPERVRRTVNGYICSIVPASPLNSSDVERKEIDDKQAQRRTNEDVKNNNSDRYVIPAKRNSPSEQSIDNSWRGKGSNTYRGNKTRRS